MNPKFKVGDPVRMKKPDLYNCTTGKVVGVEKIFQAFEDGRFDMRGLAILENTIECTSVPYKLDGDTLEIYMPESEFKMSNGDVLKRAAKTRVYKFRDYAYTVESDKMRTVYNGSSLIKA